MLDSPAVSNNLSKTLEVTRTHKIRKQAGADDKEDFFKKVQEKLGEKEKKKKEDQFYRSDEVEVESPEGKDKNGNTENDKINPVNKADKELAGPMGKSIDIKI